MSGVNLRVVFKGSATAQLRGAGSVFVLWLAVTASLIETSSNADPAAFQRAHSLATNICSQCHLFVQPDLLDRTTWREQVKPLMRKVMGLAAIESDPSPNSKLLLREWDAIWNDYYLAAAPEKMLPQDSRPPIVPDLKLFKIEDPRYAPTNCFASLVHIDADAHQLYIGNAITKSIDVLDSNGRVLSTTPVDSTLVHLLKRPNGWIGTQIGFVPPNDMPLGRVTLYDKKGNAFEKQKDLISNLVRPLHTAVAELVEPGEDLIVCSFGNLVGRMSWYGPQPNGKFVEHTLVERPGSLLSRIVDVDHDGKPDIVVMTAQGKEGIFLYHNLGKGEFAERPLIQQPPVWGYVYFEFADFNGDGYPDILTANGDLGDFACPPKKYPMVFVFISMMGNGTLKRAGSTRLTALSKLLLRITTAMATWTSPRSRISPITTNRLKKASCFSKTSAPGESLNSKRTHSLIALAAGGSRWMSATSTVMGTWTLSSAVLTRSHSAHPSN